MLEFKEDIMRAPADRAFLLLGFWTAPNISSPYNHQHLHQKVPILRLH